MRDSSALDSVPYEYGEIRRGILHKSFRSSGRLVSGVPIEGGGTERRPRHREAEQRGRGAGWRIRRSAQHVGRLRSKKIVGERLLAGAALESDS